MTYVFDLDGTLCTHCTNYADAEPMVERIAKVNELVKAGHVVIIDSARGALTGRDWTKLTREQLKVWGVLAHEIRTGVKYYGDVYVDDHAVSAEKFFSNGLAR